MNTTHDDMIARSVNRLFSDMISADLRATFSRECEYLRLWHACAEAGLERATAAEAYGGIAASLTDAYPLLHAVGYHAAPVPLAESLAAHWLLARAGIAPEDEGVVVLLDTEAARSQPRWYRQGCGRGTLSVDLNDVAWGRVARWGVAVLDTPEGASTLLVDLRGARVTGRPQMAHEPHADLELDGADVVAAACCNEQVRPRVLGAQARCAQIVGALERVLRMAVEYAGDRVQFGKPIGQNQALQQLLAAVAGQVAAARTAALVAFAEPVPRIFDVAVAKVRAGDAANEAATAVHQVHGAIAFTSEHMLHFFTQRLWAWRTEYGSDAYWARQLGRCAIQLGPESLWPAVVDRRLDMEA